MLYIHKKKVIVMQVSYDDRSLRLFGDDDTVLLPEMSLSSYSLFLSIADIKSLNSFMRGSSGVCKMVYCDEIVSYRVGRTASSSSWNVYYDSLCSDCSRTSLCALCSLFVSKVELA